MRENAPYFGGGVIKKPLPGKYFNKPLLGFVLSGASCPSAKGIFTPLSRRGFFLLHPPYNRGYFSPIPSPPIFGLLVQRIGHLGDTVDNLAYDHLKNREDGFSLSPFAPENLILRDRCVSRICYLCKVRGTMIGKTLKVGQGVKAKPKSPKPLGESVSAVG